MSGKAPKNGNQRSVVGAGVAPSLAAGRMPEQQGVAGLVLNLQRTHGNRYVQRLLRRSSLKHPDNNGSPRFKQDSGTSTIAAGESNVAGSPLDTSTRSFMESRFNHDFGQVRLHTDHSANEVAERSDAYAMTKGSDIYFSKGAYSPETEDGRATLAHELAHVVQKDQKSQPLSAPEASLEAEASRASLQVAKGQRAQVRLGASDDTALKITRSDKRGEGIKKGLFWGALAGAAVLGGAYLGGASITTELAVGVLGAGAGLGMLIGGLIGHFSAAPKRKLAKGPRPTHLETNAADVPLVADPNQPDATIQKLLPKGTRVAILDEGALQPFNRGEAKWVRIWVTTGPDMKAEGWVQRSQLESRPETTEVTREEAEWLFLELQDATFTTEEGSEAPIPYHYPVDGCYARAHRMAPLLSEKGYAYEKVFAVSRVAAKGGGAKMGLHVSTPFGPDVPAGKQPGVDWWYHVAPIIKVKQDNGELVEMVLDPSTAQGPITVDEWTKNMRPGAKFTRKTLDEVDRMVYEEGEDNQYPTGDPFTFTAPREAYKPPLPGEPFAPRDVEKEARGTLTVFAKRAQVHELAAAIRQAMQPPPVNVNAIVDAMAKASPVARSQIWTMFPTLLKSLKSSLKEADMERIEKARLAP